MKNWIAVVAIALASAQFPLASAAAVGNGGSRIAPRAFGPPAAEGNFVKPVIRDYSAADTPLSQFRYAFNGPDGVTVSWNSPNQDPDPTVYYGTDPNNLSSSSSSGTSTTYNTSTTWDNHVEITGLQPFTKYYYRVSGLDSTFDSAGQGFYFTSPRAAGDDTPFTVAAFADMGIVVGNLFDKYIPPTFGSLLEARDDYEFVWHAGDFAYADDWLWEELTGVYPYKLESGSKVYMNIWNSYFDQLSNVTKNAAYMTGPGNHEADCIEPDITPVTQVFGLDICPDGQRNFSSYLNHFSMPDRSQNSPLFEKNLWYSWDYGQVHFVQVNTETDLGAGVKAPDEAGGSGVLDAGPFGFPNQQIEWLEADLAAVDRKKTPWIVVAGHRPFYGADSGSICKPCINAFEHLLYQYEVDLYWAGHAHYYERIAPIFNGQIDSNGLNNPNAPWHITSGAAGNFEGHTSVSEPYPNYTVYLDKTNYGWSKLIFHNSTHLEQQFLAASTGEVVDSAILYKAHGSSQQSSLQQVGNSTMTHDNASSIAAPVGLAN